MLRYSQKTLVQKYVKNHIRHHSESPTREALEEAIVTHLRDMKETFDEKANTPRTAERYGCVASFNYSSEALAAQGYNTSEKFAEACVNERDRQQQQRGESAVRG